MKGLLYDKGKLDNILYFQIHRDENYSREQTQLLNYLLYLYFFFHISISFNLCNTNKTHIVLCLIKLHYLLDF